MRIIFCVTTQELFESRCGALARELRSAGHKVMALYHVPSESQSDYAVHCNWPQFKFGYIESFRPDLIIMWNGYYPHMHAAMQYLKTKYQVGFMEMGWFPQKGFSYLAEDLAQRSAISKIPYEEDIASSAANQEFLTVVRGFYTTQLPAGLVLPERYVFVPMQLEHDTQITCTSSQFKDMSSLLGFARAKFRDLPVVFRNHPLLPDAVPDIGDDCGITNMTDKCASLPLAVHAEVVVGINSTLLAESMLFLRETIALGEHVAGREISRDWSHSFTVRAGRDVLKDRYEYRALVLLYNQWSYENPPGWVIDKISQRDFAPRKPQK